MNEIEGITEQIRAMVPTLTRLDYCPFTQECKLEFHDGRAKRAVLKLSGIHFWATRQSPLGAVTSELPSVDCSVDFFDISGNTPFLTAFLNGDLPLEGSVTIYDCAGNSQDSRDFVSPVHVNVNCTDGILDVICERVEMVVHPEDGTP